MNRTEFAERTSRNQKILQMLLERLGPVSMVAVTKATGCAWTTLERMLNRGGPPKHTTGPDAQKMSGQELYDWLLENVPLRTPAEEADILRALADDIEAGRA